jgi:hypothetical protein
MLTGMVLIYASPKRDDAVTVAIVAVGTVKFPSTPTLLIAVTVPDSVLVPDTTSVVAERLDMMVADRVVNPDTPRLFWMVAAETVRRPLILAAFETLRDEMLVTAFPADILPITVKSFRTLADESVARPPTDAPEVVVNEYRVETPPTLRLFRTVADDSVARPLMVAAFQTFRAETVATADPAEMVAWTTREF